MVFGGEASPAESLVDNELRKNSSDGGLGNDQLPVLHLIDQPMFLIDTLRPPARQLTSQRFGLADATKWNARVSSIRRNRRFAGLGLVCTQNCRSSKACGLNSKRIFQVFHGLENAMLGIGSRHGFPQPRRILCGSHQAIGSIPGCISLGAKRLAEE
jgi:hypothetical protein